MIFFPAIDLMQGEVVRLQQGRRDAKTVYSSDPLAVALEWKAQGAHAFHIVDLDGAFTGTPENLEIVDQIIEQTNLFCQLGGGMRDLDTIQKALKMGIQRVIIGSKACDSLTFIQDAVKKFGAERIAISIDARDGKAATQGWTAASTWSALELAQGVVNAGIRTIIYTDISTDGMLQGPNTSAIQQMIEKVPMQLISSGGVSSLDDINRLVEIPRLYGIIVGTALYEKKFSLNQCLSLTH